MNSLTTLLRQHWRAIYLLYLAIALAGYLAYQNLPSDVYPELSFPRIAVIATAGDTAPERMLVSVTRVLEEAASQVYRVRWVRSKTIRGSTELSIEFQHGTDMVFALHQLQGRLSEVQSRLPAGVAMTVEMVTPAIFPVISYNVTAEALTQADLYTICRYQLQPALSRVAGVSRVQIQGGDIPQISVQVNPDRMRSYGLSLNQVADALRKTNQIQVVGRVDAEHQQNLVVASGEAVNIPQIENLVLVTRGVNPVYLKDVASVSPGYADRTSMVSVQQHLGIVVSIFRQPTSNVIAVSNGVRDELKELRKSLPLGVIISPAYDESTLVRYSIANVHDAITVGIVMIVVVLFAFLRSWRTTLIASLTIPLSAFASFGFMYLLGQSLNLMSLGGLAVAIGLVIDDAIVVIENIHRQLQLGLEPAQAVRQALTELAGPVISSTATTVVVFLPLGLLSGVTGEFFNSLTVTLASAVIFSLLLALTLTPMLSIQLLKPDKKAHDSAPSWFTRGYMHLLKAMLQQPIWAILSAVAILSGACAIYGKLGTDFLPEMDEGSYVVDYLAPPGAALPEVDRLASKLEAVLANTPEVQTWTRRTGAELGLFATETNKGDVLVVLKHASQRKRKAEEIMEDQRKEIAETVPQLDVDFHQILQDQLNDLSGAPRPIEVRVYGEDPAMLRQYSGQVQETLEHVKGVVDVTNSSREGAPELDLGIDPVRTGRLGLSPADVATQVSEALLGAIATQIRQGDRLIDVRVRLSDSVRSKPEELERIPIIAPNGAALPLSAMASITKRSGQREIDCENQQRYVAVEGGLEGRDLGSAVAEIKSKVAAIALAPGYTITVEGLYASQQETFRELLSVLALASMLVYLLLVFQFRSLTQPIAIFVAVPLALFGVEVALLLTKTPLNVSSFMGIILLVGLVVKNGIILLEYTNRLRESGVPLDEALITAGGIRLRPIIMTTLCTLLGLLPLAIGIGPGAELQKPLAIAVIGGLSFSTVFTLVFVPVLYRLLTMPFSRPEQFEHQ